ncbi:Ankyrin repeats (3 copies) [Legionella beliardensis]|uniref:Ankyrin repeats (3 copies) n=1 Tax=Legionella beliardensis TaxID=91822 RepID=A0A378JQZ6_9GAMM|nr:ankyrin repeat domain-containing protein [Legionella beliardensis]STX55607.1 Ankyrin repeats (3 copies) [Legionella beliardensis]
MIYKYILNNDSHYVEVDHILQEEEQDVLSHILSFFPHCGDSRWIQRFTSLQFELFDTKLLKIAANAYDSNGNTVLGVACENGKSVAVVQKLIDLGANLNISDHNMNKLALHWAISNKRSWNNKASYEAVAVVKCLLENGAMTHIKCYDYTTPLGYAVSRGYIAAANLIRTRDHDFTSHALFHLFNKLLPLKICSVISASLNIKTGIAISIVNKEVNRNMIGYIPNKSIYARFFSTQSDKELEKSHNTEEQANRFST